MISPKRFRDKTNGGLLSIDVLVALALSVVYIALIADMNWRASDLFIFSKTKEDVLIAFENGNSDVQYSHSFYGNERRKENLHIASSSVTFFKVFGEENGDLAGSSLCNPIFTKVREAAVHMLSVDPTLPLTDIEVRNNVAYVSADSADYDLPDLLLFRLAGYDTALIDSANTGPGLTAITINRDKIFAAAASSAYELHVLSLDQDLRIASISKYKLPLPYATASPPFASSIFSRGKTMILGTEKWDGPELFVYDITTAVPPLLKGSHEVGSKVNDIFSWNDKAYVAASGEDQLIELDISDSADPKRLSSFSPSGFERQIGTAARIFEGSLSFGRNSGGYNVKEDHEFFKWNSEEPDATADYSIDFPGGAYGPVLSASKIAFASRKSGSEFVLMDGNAASSSVQIFDLPVLPQTMTCDNSSIYLLAKSAPVIYEFKMDGP